MKILIIGSEGFIGNHCITYYRNKQEVFGVDLFNHTKTSYTYKKISRSLFELDEIFKAEEFDVIINASGSGNVQYSMKCPLIDFDANCLDTIRVLDVIRKNQANCKYIHLSSAAVYGNPETLPISESDVTNPLSVYGWHKLAAEQLCKEYSSVFGVQTAILRPFSVYGPGLRKQMFWDLFQKSKSTNIEIHGTGKESRDYIYIDDLIQAIDVIIKGGVFEGEIYNAASGKEVTIQSAISVFFMNFDNQIKYFFNNKIRKGDPLNWKADITKLQELGFKPTTTLKEGLEKTVKWLNRYE